MNQCHICASTEVEYIHTIQWAVNPAIMINVCYCRRCSRMMDEMEQILHERLVKE